MTTQTSNQKKLVKVTISEGQKGYGCGDQVFKLDPSELNEFEVLAMGFTHVATMTAGQIAKFRKMRFPDAVLEVTKMCQFGGKENEGEVYFSL